ncbi:MAG: ABC transporter ATP-binding protein [Solirubrobacteraceae bacterium]
MSCQGVAKSFAARPVLHDVDLDVPAGTLTAVLGTSGSGKTTLLRLIVGFISLEGGMIKVGKSVVATAGRKPLPPDKRAIGYVAQEGALFPHLRVGENVGFGLRRRDRERTARIIEALELVGLGEHDVGRHPHELSGGEQRRVSLARALAPRPRLVLLDEPFTGLDASLRVETRHAVLRALADAGSTAVMVTHDQGEALSMGREVAVLRQGRLVQTATPAALYRTPVDLEVARFVGEAVVLSGQASGDVVTCQLGELRVRDADLAGPVQVMVRPEQIRFRTPAESEGDDVTAGARRVSGRVLAYSYYGPDTVVKLALGPEATPITARTFDHDLPQIGEFLELSVVGPVVTYTEPSWPVAQHPSGDGRFTDLPAPTGADFATARLDHQPPT